MNAYFALSTFKDDSSRRAVNAAYTRCFFLDLDCGNGKPYATQADAAQALREFVTRIGLPEPFLVNSGRGIHAYWPIEEVLETSSWVSLANRFKQLCLNSDFAFDPAVPADAARVLRIPDTKNFKSNPPLSVYKICDGVVSKLADFVRLLPASTEDLFSAREYAQDEFTKAVATEGYPPSEFARLADRSLKGTGCAQIAKAIQEAETLEEPLWRAALSIAWRCTDAEEAIHKLSRPHPDYDPEETVQKAQLTKGPSTCKWYKDNYGDDCKSCAHSITSPILLARKVEASAEEDGVYKVVQQLDPDNVESAVARTIKVDIPAYPHPYFRGMNGGVYIRSRTKEGDPEEIELYPYDLYVTNRHYDSDESGDGEGEVVQINLHTPHDGIRRFKTPVVNLMSKDKLRDTLVKHGVVAYGKKVDDIMAYLASSVKNLQRMFAAERTRNQMGWTTDNEGFVVGELEYTKTGIRLAPAASTTRSIAPYFSAKGDIEAWSDIANFFARPGCEAHAFTVLLGFGAPLLKLFNTVSVRGAMINLYSNKGGTGKTTAQMVCNSIFGHPSELLLKKDDTVAAKLQWMGMLNTIAVTMDEITNITDEDLSALTYEIPQGRAKHRMEAQYNKLRKNFLTWTTFAITSSNSSMYDKIMRLKSIADGEVRRLIEVYVPEPEGVSKATTDAVFAGLAYNYGVAGPIFIQYVLDNMEEVAKLLQSVKTRVDNQVRMEQADRFYSHVFACALAAGLICKQLGILDYDMKHMFEYCTGLVTGIKREVLAQMDDVATVARETVVAYINENINNLLIINVKRANDKMPLPAPIQLPKTALRLRYEPDTNELWIPANALRDLFVAKQLDIKSALPQLATIGMFKHGGRAVTKRIGAGAMGSFEAGGVRCYCIDGTFVGMDVDAQTQPAANAA